MKAGDLVKRARVYGGSMRWTHGIVIRAPTASRRVLIFWPGEEPVWERRRYLMLLQEAA